MSLAYWFLKNDYEVDLYEASEKSGGLLETKIMAGGHLAESAANGFLFQPEFEALEKDLGLRFVATRAAYRKRFFYRGGFKKWPLSILESLVAITKLSLNVFAWVPKHSESIRQWGTRLMGKAASKYLIETGLQGIYAGRAQDMSASLVMGPYLDPKKRKEKQKHSRLQFESEARWGTFSHAEGMGALMRDWSQYLEKHKDCRVQYRKKCSFEDFKSDLNGGAQLFVCVPPHAAAKFFEDSHPKLSESLGKVEMLPVLSATLVFPKIKGEEGIPQGFGILFARDEGFEVLGVLRNHCIFEGRSDEVSETWIYSGQSLKERNVWKDERACEEMILKEREKLTGVRLDPLAQSLKFWDEALPHYTLALRDVLESNEVKTLTDAGVQLFGNYTGQIGLSRLFLAARNTVLNTMEEK